jgi:tRNA (guanine37-N1)-methyltransferase
MGIRERLKGKVPEESLARLSDRFHVIGDIAIVALPSELKAYRTEIADAVLSSGKSIHTVLNKTSGLQGERRVCSYEVLAGNGSTVTVHREFGFFYRLDVASVFFSSRLGHEHMRVADQVRAGEDVLLPFAGVGPFAVPLAARGARVVAVEKNRDACLYLQENARKNQVDDRIEIINADAFLMKDMLQKDFCRAVIPAPYGANGALESVLPRVRSGGLLHFYTFKKISQIPALKKSYEDLELEVIFFRRCGNVAPGVSRWVFDLVRL